MSFDFRDVNFGVVGRNLFVIIAYFYLEIFCWDGFLLFHLLLLLALDKLIRKLGCFDEAVEDI